MFQVDRFHVTNKITVAYLTSNFKKNFEVLQEVLFIDRGGI